NRHALSPYADADIRVCRASTAKRPACSWLCGDRTHSSISLHIQIPHFERVLLDEVAPRPHLIAHEDREDFLHAGEVLELDLQQGAGFRVHRGLPELLGVHFPKTLVPLQPDPLLPALQDRADQSCCPGAPLLLPLRLALASRPPAPAAGWGWPPRR